MSRLPFLALAALFYCRSPLPAQVPERVSVNAAGHEATESSSHPSISHDGRYVAFQSEDRTLVPGDPEDWNDVFVHDRATGIMRVASVNSLGASADRHSHDPSISGDGRAVAFYSNSTNLVSGVTIPWHNIYVHELLSGQTIRASLSTSGAEPNAHCFNPALSFDGRFVVFDSAADTLVPGDTNAVGDVFVHDRRSGVTERISISSAAAQGDGASTNASISADGRYVAFTSTATNLVGGDTNAKADVFVHDRQTGLTTRVSVDSSGREGNGASDYSALAADGRTVVFNSLANNLVAGDANNVDDVFVHDRLTGTTTRASVSSLGAEADGLSMKPTCDASGRLVCFQSTAGNLVAGTLRGYFDVYVHDRLTGETWLVSRNASGVAGNAGSLRAVIASAGRHVAFSSGADNLIAGDRNAVDDVFVAGPGDAVVHLVLDGGCPGPVAVTIWNATPGGAVGILSGVPGGSFVKPTPPCQGVLLDLGTPTPLRLLRADARGRIELPVNPTAASCGSSLQVMDVASCTTSLALVL